MFLDLQRGAEFGYFTAARIVWVGLSDPAGVLSVCVMSSFQS